MVTSPTYFYVKAFYIFLLVKLFKREQALSLGNKFIFFR